MAFYLTRSYQYALKWAKGFPQKGAVIVYRLNQKEINQFTGLNLIEDKEKWIDLVWYNRAGKHAYVHRPKRNIRKMYNDIDYIEGSMVANGFTCNSKEWKPNKPALIDDYQLCILSQRMAYVLGHAQYIDSVIFFSSDTTAW